MCILVLIGQVFGGMTQPFYVNSCARIGNEWFSVNGRDLAITLLSIANTIGIALAMIVPSIFIRPNSVKFYGFTGLSFLIMTISIILFFMTYILWY